MPALDDEERIELYLRRHHGSKIAPTAFPDVARRVAKRTHGAFAESDVIYLADAILAEPDNAFLLARAPEPAERPVTQAEINRMTAMEKLEFANRNPPPPRIYG